MSGAAASAARADAAASRAEVNVCLVLEPGYPYEGGFLSEWTADLLFALAPTTFGLVLVHPHGDLPRTLVREVPRNVKRLVEVTVAPPAGRYGRRSPALRLVEAVRTRHERREQVDAMRPLVAAITLAAGQRSAVWSEARLGDGPSLATPSTPQIWAALDALRGYVLRFGASALLSEPRLLEVVTEVYRLGAPRLGYRNFVSTMARLLAAVGGLMREDLPRARIVHALGRGHAALVGALAARAQRAPLVVSDLGSADGVRFERLLRQALGGAMRPEVASASPLMSREAWPYVDLLVAGFERLSELVLRTAARGIAAHKDALERLYEGGLRRGSGAAITRGVDVPRFADLGASKRRRPESRRIGFYGRFVPEDDLKAFINAARIVVDRVDLVELIAVGYGEPSGTYLDDCRVRAQLLGVERNVKITGQTTLTELLTGLDVCVITSPTHDEPPGLLEAMAAGVVVVAVDFGPVREILERPLAREGSAPGPAGVLVAPGDHEALAAAVVRLCRDDALAAELGEAGRVRAHRYRREQALADVEAVYAELR